MRANCVRERISDAGKGWRVMKKAAFALLLLGITVSILSGCGPGKSDSARTEITFTYGAGVQNNILYSRLIKGFEKANPDIKVKAIEIAPKFYYQKVQTLIAGNTAPDVMWMGQGFGELVAKGAFMDLDAVFKEFDSSRYYEKVVDWYRYKGHLMGFPSGIDMELLFYNKTLFDNYGIPYPNKNWNLEDMVAAARKLTMDTNGDGIIDQFGFSGLVELGLFGAGLLNSSATASGLDTAAATECLQFNIDLKKRYKVSPVWRANGAESISEADLFKTGKLAMHRNCTWSMDDFRQGIKGFDWDICLMPYGRKKSYWASSSGLAIAAGSSHKEAAIRFLKYIVSSQGQQVLSGINLPVMKDVAEKVVRDNTGKPENIKILLDAVPYLEPYPRVPQINRIVTIWVDKVERAHAGIITARQACLEASEEINEIIKKSD
ncbi:MAG: sugar ABC transporter substrate-binding protein [bacterium]|nr:sugar ABC transporter substrate-binding protein [bacterium]MDD4153303.1 sugar ABC transporter substrate-binding protein [bacterium]